jgi:hypothetical protein
MTIGPICKKRRTEPTNTKVRYPTAMKKAERKSTSHQFFIGLSGQPPGLAH